VDQVEADLVLLSTEAVHSKAVDANLLAEFVDCPGGLILNPIETLLVQVCDPQTTLSMPCHICRSRAF